MTAIQDAVVQASRPAGDSPAGTPSHFPCPDEARPSRFEVKMEQMRRLLVFLEEQEETFRAFMKWLYPAYIGLTLLSLPPDYDAVALFQLYAFAQKYSIKRLEDAVVSVLYRKFANSNDLWFTLSSDKLTLETFIKVVPSGTNPYGLVVRSLADYICSPSSDGRCFEPDGALRNSTRRSTSATESQVEEVMESEPSELWGSIFNEILLVKPIGAWRQGFENIIGYKMVFLRRFEDLARADSSAS